MRLLALDADTRKAGAVLFRDTAEPEPFSGCWRAKDLTAACGWLKEIAGDIDYVIFDAPTNFRQGRSRKSTDALSRFLTGIGFLGDRWTPLKRLGGLLGSLCEKRLTETCEFQPRVAVSHIRGFDSCEWAAQHMKSRCLVMALEEGWTLERFGPCLQDVADALGLGKWFLETRAAARHRKDWAKRSDWPLEVYLGAKTCSAT